MSEDDKWRWRKTQQFEGAKGPVNCCCFSSGNGRYLISGGQDRAIRLYNCETTSLVQTYTSHGYEVLGLAV